MRYLCILLICLSWGLLVRCAPAPSQSTSTLTEDQSKTAAELTSATPAPTFTPLTVSMPPTTLTPTLPPASAATEESQPTVVPTKLAPVSPTNTPLSLPSATALATETPPLQPTALPPTVVATVVSAASGEGNAEQVKYGLEVYQKLYCGLCHKLDAAGTAGTFGPPHNDLGTVAAQLIQDPQYRGKATTAAEYIHESIVDPKAFLVPGYEQTPHQMPVYNFLSETDVEALVQMLLQQK